MKVSLKIIFIYVSLLLVTTQSVWAETMYTRGFYGQIEFRAINDKIDSQNALNDKLSLIQKYSLGYESYLYSPLLLTYDIGGTLYIDNTDATITSSSTKTSTSYRSEHTNYRAYLNFIKQSDYPFTLYAERADSPVWSTQADRNTFVKYEADRMGIFGSLLLDIFDLNYELRNSDSRREESFSTSTDKELRFKVGMTKQISSDQSMYADYTHRIVEYEYRDSGVGILTTIDGDIDEARVGYDWKVSEALRLRSYARYYSYSYYDNEDISATVSLNYLASKKLSTSFSVTANSIRVANDQNSYITINQGSNYQATSELSFSQNFIYFQALGDSLGLNYTSLMLGTNYRKTIIENLIGSIGLSVTGRSEQYDRVDANSTLSDKNIFSYTLSAGLDQSFPSTKTNIYLNTSYYQRFSTADDYTNRAVYAAGLTQPLASSTNFFVRFNGYRDENLYEDVNATVKVVEAYTVETGLSYWGNLGYYGKMSFNAGVAYAEGIFKNRVTPYASLSLKYMLMRSLNFNAHGRVSSDSVYDYTTYSGDAKLTYIIRKIYASVGTRYTSQNGGAFGHREHINYYFVIGRNI